MPAALTKWRVVRDPVRLRPLVVVREIRLPVLGATLKVFLADGTPTGLRTGEVINWTLRAVAAPRNRLQGVQDRAESDQPGVYLLWGPDDENPTRMRVYVGEGDPVWPRLRATPGREGLLDGPHLDLVKQGYTQQGAHTVPGVAAD